MMQAAALPFRFMDGGHVELLLVTSRTQRRWILPKSRIPRRLQPSEAAERKAREEAGVMGAVARSPLAIYHQIRRKAGGTQIPITVLAHPVKVETELPVCRNWAYANAGGFQ